MAKESPVNLRAFVRRNTRLMPVPDLPGISLNQADDVMKVMSLAGTELGETDPGLPFWAFAWAGGLGVSRYLVDHPDEVAGRRVVDIASGSGLCAIVAMRSGAAWVHAIDIDPLSEAAVALNAHANGMHIGFSRQDLLGAEPPECDVILAGDVCYEETMAARMIAWLRLAAAMGTRVLVGDPGRKYMPPGMERLAVYQVRTSHELEDAELKESAVYTFPPEP
jgi:predicted nicotinamide N-methyase